jgi:hypothetical protein
VLRLLALAIVPLALVSGTAAAGGGPSPGIVTGWDGVVDAPRSVRYVALPSTRTTAVAAVRTSDGRVLRWTTLRGVYGVATVAFDGTTEGVSRDGDLLVLAGIGAQAGPTRFAVLRTSPLRLRKAITLPGLWAYDALSPDGRILYATQYHGTGQNAGYDVRAVSLVTGRPVGAPLVDKREPDEEMNGSPWARARSNDGAWAYTLYAKPNGTAFVHALDTARRRAFCVELPWRSSIQRLAAVKLSLADGDRTLVLTKSRSRKLAAIDTRSFRVRAFAKP